MTCKENESRNKIERMIGFLKNLKISKSHIVFNGDEIDQKAINETIKNSIQQENKRPNELMRIAFDYASLMMCYI
jgi:hypothetical protein